MDFKLMKDEIAKLETNLEIETAKFFALDDLPADVDDLCISVLDEFGLFDNASNISDRNRYYHGAEA